jgi:hypothetical protein
MSTLIHGSLALELQALPLNDYEYSSRLTASIMAYCGCGGLQPSLVHAAELVVETSTSAASGCRCRVGVEGRARTLTYSFIHVTRMLVWLGPEAES